MRKSSHYDENFSHHSENGLRKTLVNNLYK